jgi:hypothetical protein
MNNNNNNKNEIIWNPRRNPSSTVKRRKTLFTKENKPLTYYGINRYNNNNGSVTYAHRYRRNNTGNVITFTNFVPGPPLPNKNMITTTPTKNSSPLRSPPSKKRKTPNNKRSQEIFNNLIKYFPSHNNKSIKNNNKSIKNKK